MKQQVEKRSCTLHRKRSKDRDFVKSAGHKERAAHAHRLI